MIIRPAVAYDEGAFERLWRILLEDGGGDAIPTPRTLQFFFDLFHLYTTQSELGCVAVAENESGKVVGLVMWGESVGGMPYDSKFGRTAFGWGTVVEEEERGKGISVALRRFAEKDLREKGFHTVVGTVFRSNVPAVSSVDSFGFSYQSMNVYYSLWRSS